MKKLLIFGGTSEEHDLLEALEPFGLETILCVASDYGRMMAPEGNRRLRVRTGRLDANQIGALIRREGFFCVIDSTHPYAVEATKNIKAAALETGISYLRLLREKSDTDSAIVVRSIGEAAKALDKSSGNVLLTTGSKELSAFTGVRDFAHRLYARVLPTAESINACLENGFLPHHIIAMHGPFSHELNIAIMRQFDIRLLVTKDGGRAGGYPDKLSAARALNADVIVIRRPEEDGLKLADIHAAVSKLLEVAK